MAKEDYSRELDAAIQEADTLLPGKTSAQPIMKFISSAESDYGRYDPETALSYGPFQIDPVRYYDIAQNPDRVNPERLSKVNTYLQKRLSDEGFDISKLGTYNPETSEYDDVNLGMMRHPLIGAMLTRMALMQDEGDLPEQGGLADYYMDFWKPKDQSDEKKSQAKGKYNLYHPDAPSTQPVDDTMAGYNNVESAFTK